MSTLMAVISLCKLLVINKFNVQVLILCLIVCIVFSFLGLFLVCRFVFLLC